MTTTTKIIALLDFYTLASLENEKRKKKQKQKQKKKQKNNNIIKWLITNIFQPRANRGDTLSLGIPSGVGEYSTNTWV